MGNLIADSFVVLAVLSAWVALRFAPLWLILWSANPERRWLAHFMVVFHIMLAHEHFWFFLGRLDRGPRTDFWSTHWTVLLAQAGMIWACIGWMLVLDWRQRRYLVIGPTALAFGAAAILPP